MKLRQGDKVTVWTDPVAKQKVEGVATLKWDHGRPVDGYEVWDVEFPGEERRVTRIVHPNDKVEG